jgi:ClpX C4-type zinc finger
MSKVGSDNSKNTLYCSFCGKSQHEVRKLIAGRALPQAPSVCNFSVAKWIRAGAVANWEGDRAGADLIS